MSNTVSAGEHVPEAERYIRTVKERVQSTYNTLPFQRMPALVIMEMVKTSIQWLNNFPPKGGVSPTMSPRAIITGKSFDYNKHCHIEFGAHAQTHEEHDNSMATRTTGAIALRPTGNAQGGHYFMSLTTGRRLNRNFWTELPMPKEVIDHVHVLAQRFQHLPPGLLFGDRNGEPDDDDDDTDDDDRRALDTHDPDDSDDSDDESKGANDDSDDDDR